MSRPRYALVLSGGGARGAYEAGVLRYILDELPRRLDRPVRFDIVTGTSVGAVHACYIAATVGMEENGRRLTDVWQALSAETIYHLTVSDVIGAPLKLLGLMGRGEEALVGDRATGLLNTSRLEEVVQAGVPWQNIRRNIDSGEIAALAVAATEVASGRTKVFVDNATGEVAAWDHDPFVDAHPAHIGPLHALASASIPMLFPLLKIDGRYYCDGGLRLNTPLAPALRLGADRVLVIGLRSAPDDSAAGSNGDANGRGSTERSLLERREVDCTRPTFLAGKVLNALLLDHIDYDLDRLRLFNAILERGNEAYGNAFLDRINEPIRARRGIPYRVVRDLCIRPSRDLGELAFECADHRPWSAGMRAYLTGALVRYAARGTAGEGDFLSYLLFDHCYADHLVQLGMRDAESQSDELVEFFEE